MNSHLRVTRQEAQAILDAIQVALDATGRLGTRQKVQLAEAFATLETIIRRPVCGGGAR
jgi:hypothetical protein